MNCTSDRLVGTVYLVVGILAGAAVVTSVLTAVTDDGGLVYPVVVYSCFILGIFILSTPSIIEGYKN